MRKTVKITDVARKAGVSPSTVSHALNHKRPISPETVEKVNRAIRELGYVPDYHASRMKSRKSGVIGFYASDITDPFVTTIIRGVEKKLIESDNTILFCSGIEFDGDLQQAVRFMDQRAVDGIIVCYGTTQQSDSAAIPDQQSMPMVYINRDAAPRYTSLLLDDERAGQDAAQHFYSLGLEFPVIISGPENRIASRKRVSGFCKEWKNLGRTALPSERIIKGDLSFKSGKELAGGIIKTYKIDSFFCCNDHMAAGAIEAAHEAGLKVPEDIRVLGVDDREFCEFWPVPISTFSIPLRDMGYRSAEILLSINANTEGPFKKELFKEKLIIRESTGIKKTED